MAETMQADVEKVLASYTFLHSAAVSESETTIEKIHADAKAAADGIKSSENLGSVEMQAHGLCISECLNLRREFKRNDDGSYVVPKPVEIALRAEYERLGVSRKPSEQLRQTSWILVCGVHANSIAFLKLLGKGTSPAACTKALEEMPDGTKGEKVCSRGAVWRITRTVKPLAERFEVAAQKLWAMSEGNEHPLATKDANAIIANARKVVLAAVAEQKTEKAAKALAAAEKKAAKAVAKMVKQEQANA